MSLAGYRLEVQGVGDWGGLEGNWRGTEKLAGSRRGRKLKLDCQEE